MGARGENVRLLFKHKQTVETKAKENQFLLTSYYVYSSKLQPCYTE